jgi:hypothetical protein
VIANPYNNGRSKVFNLLRPDLVERVDNWLIDHNR